jgi:hypothetical protein
MITARKVGTKERWVPDHKGLDLFVGADAPPSPTKAAAQAAALERGQKDAERVCRPISAGTLYRFVSAAPQPDVWTCNSSGGGYVCSFSGQADCAVERREVTETETCGN